MMPTTIGMESHLSLSDANLLALAAPTLVQVAIRGRIAQRDNPSTLPLSTPQVAPGRFSILPPPPNKGEADKQGSPTGRHPKRRREEEEESAPIATAVGIRPA